MRHGLCQRYLWGEQRGITPNADKSPPSRLQRGEERCGMSILGIPSDGLTCGHRAAVPLRWPLPVTPARTVCSLSPPHERGCAAAWLLAPLATLF